MMVGVQEIERAAQRIEQYIRTTPVIQLEPNIWGLKGQLYMKLEYMQHSGSFKARGAFNRMLSAQELPEAGVIAASGGNHGIAVAYAAQQIGIRSEIFVPEISAPAKVERLRAYGARVNVIGASYAEALQASEVRARESGALVVHAYDQPEVIAGQGTVGYEIAQQVPQAETVLVAVGGGGLIAGIASWYRGAVQVIGVESEQTQSMTAALTAGKPVNVEVGGIAADALGARRVGELAFTITQKYVARVDIVSDQAIRQAQHLLWQDLRIVVEPSGATALAALLDGVYQPHDGEQIVVVLCGANVHIDF